MATRCLDDFLKVGKYTILVSILCELTILLQAGNLMFMVFGGATPKLIGCNGNVTTDIDWCQLYESEQCEQPILQYQFLSVNVEFDHLCSNGKHIKDSTSYQMIGYMLGAIVFGQISDIYGRKRPMLICIFLTGIVGVASSFSTNLTMFTILRTLLSFFNTGHIVIVMVFMCEQFPKHIRMPLNFLLSWSPNIIIVTLIAYLSGNWRTFSIALNSIAFIACALLIFAEESSFWLIRKGKTDEVMNSMKRIYTINGDVLDEMALEKVLEEEKIQYEKKFQGSYFFQHLFCTWTLMGYSFTMMISFFAASVINDGIMFNMESLSGSMYFNTVFIGTFRFFLNILSAIVDMNFTWMGRKITHLFFAVYAIVAITVVLFIHIMDLNTQLSTYTRYLVISAGSMVCQLYVINGVTCSEIFPTAIRNIAYASTQISGSLGSIIGPQLFRMSSISPLLPFISMIFLQFGDAISFLSFIPESKGKQMADQMPTQKEMLPLFRGKEGKVGVEMQEKV